MKPAPPARRAAAPTPAAASRPDSGMTLRGDREGTVFRSLTVEGEDRIHFEFERPPLRLDVDPLQAPGLDLGSTRDVLDRTVPDLAAPLVALTAHEPSPYLARPWLGQFASGAVARFRPDVKDVERWRLVVANARGEAVATFQGRGEPPREIAWDGRSPKGQTVVPDLTYSYVFEAYDRAGNKRNFVGEGFQVSAYRLDAPEGPVLVFSGRELATAEADARRAGAAPAVPPVLLEAATWMNQAVKPRQPVRVIVTARSFESGNALASSVTRSLGPLLLGDPARVQSVVQVEPDSPEGGTVRIAADR
jgi:hypothetical protein